MVYYQQNNKYYNTKKVSNEQGKWDSKFEQGFSQELDLRVKAKDIKSYESQVNLDLVVNGYIVCQYRIDFIIHHNDGTKEYTETKGYPTPLWKLKWKLFEALFCDLPDTKLTVIYQGRNKWNPRKRKHLT